MEKVIFHDDLGVKNAVLAKTGLVQTTAAKFAYILPRLGPRLCQDTCPVKSGL